MKFFSISLISLSTSILALADARNIEPGKQQAVINFNLEEPKFLIDIAGEQQWVTEDEKWEIRRNGKFFVDITDTRDLGSINRLKALSVKKPTYPSKPVHKDTVIPLFKDLNKTNIQTHLEYFTTFHNRYYRSPFGAHSCRWLLNLINETLVETGADKYGITVRQFIHPWDQFSIIVNIPGKSDSLVILGAHQDSVNHLEPVTGRAPGADDDGSGTMTTLETMRVLLSRKEILLGKAKNTIEFHWYSGEEAGLLGSQRVFDAYEKEGKDVKAMLQTDMTGFIHRTLEAGLKPQFGLMMDIMDEPLMNFTKTVIDEYTDVEWVETGCGHTCGSDHMSAIRAGYPGVYVIEANFKYCDNHLHGTDDLIKYLDFDHMIDHAKYILGFTYELAFAKL